MAPVEKASDGEYDFVVIGGGSGGFGAAVGYTSFSSSNMVKH